MLWTAAIYRPVRSAPFVFDDTRSIVANPSLRHLWPLGPVLAPPARMTVSGRPLANLSLALNFAAGGLAVQGYHAVNLAIHVAAGLVLAGLVRRTAARGGLKLLTPEQAGWAAALLWLVHPLQTEAVSYVVQRTEALAALAYLLTLYSVARCAAGPGRGWRVGAIAACAAGMASKETMVSAPLVALLYDRTFWAGSFSAAIRERRGLYLGLASTWLLLAYLVVTNSGRGGSVALSGGVGVGSYLVTQGWALLHYLRLALWPAPLIFDYGTATLSVRTAGPALVIVMLLLVATVVALRRAPVLGFLGAAFFAILAPSSSVIPIVTETVAEHRMYLPLAVLAVAFVWALDRCARRQWVALAACGGLACGLSAATVQRNRDYQDPIRLWQSTVDHRPFNARAQSNLGQALSEAGRGAAAIPCYRESLRLDPSNSQVWFNLAQEEAGQGQPASAISAFETALRLDPRSTAAHVNLAVVLEQSGQHEAALSHFRAAVALSPGDPKLLDNLGLTLARGGNLSAAAQAFERALQLDPTDTMARTTLARIQAATATYPGRSTPP